MLVDGVGEAARNFFGMTIGGNEGSTLSGWGAWAGSSTTMGKV